MRTFLFFSAVGSLSLIVLASCGTSTTAPPLGDCPTCTFRAGKQIAAGDSGADSGKPATDSGTPDGGTPDSGTPDDSGTPSDAAPDSNNP